MKSLTANASRFSKGAWAATLALAFALAAVACSGGGGGNTPTAVTGISVNPTEMTLYTSDVVGGTAKSLTASILPSSATNKNVTWGSSDSTKATVTGSGLTATVSPVAVGTATITVTTQDSQHVATCAVRVEVGVQSVVLSTPALSMGVGDAPVSLTATALPSGAANRDVRWASGNTGVVSVVGSGANNLTATVTAVGAGSTVVTATSVSNPGVSAACTVTVAPGVPVGSVAVAPGALALTVGGSGALSATVLPGDATNKSVEWTSGNTAVATVQGNGQTATVIAMAAGSATITVASKADPEKKAECQVTVTGLSGSVMYVAGGFGLYANGALNAAIGRQSIEDVAVDATGAVHAVGSYLQAGIGKPAYYKNGARTLLPMTAGGQEGVCHGVTVTNDGHVYIAYAERDSSPNGDWFARLWVDGQLSPLGGVGLPDQWGYTLWTQAWAVCVNGGHVYVSGRSETVNSNYASYGAIWKDGQKYVLNIMDTLYQMDIDPTGAFYVRNFEGVHKVAPDLSSSQVVVGYYEGICYGMSLDGADIYAAGASGEDACYWKNGVLHLLPKPAAAVSISAYAVHASGGHFYIAGVVEMPDGFYVQLWVDGQMVAPDAPTAIKQKFNTWDEAVPNAILFK